MTKLDHQTFIIGLGFLVLVFNCGSMWQMHRHIKSEMVLGTTSSITTFDRSGLSFASEASRSLTSTEDGQSSTEKSYLRRQHTKQAKVKPKRPKVLFGMISSDTFNGNSYRKRQRELFRIWNDDRVCSLADFQERTPEEREPCELIYTFVIGANNDEDAPTEIVDDSFPLLVEKPIQAYKADVNWPDVTLLNIRENMNEGKSQTFLYFGALMCEEYGIDYVVKFDADSQLHLHDYLKFAHENLPPAPYNKNVMAGAMRDKAYWPKGNPEDLARKEGYFGSQFEGVHLYLAGQMYLFSHDLAKFIAEEAPYSRTRIAEGGYVEGHEDHDISAMAFHSEKPVHMVPIAKQQRFWEHPVKGQRRWERIMEREKARMAGEEFEGRILRLY